MEKGSPNDEHNAFNGKSWPVNRDIVNYYIIKLPIPPKFLNKELSDRYYSQFNRDVDLGGVAKALRRGTISPEVYCILLEIIKEETVKARQNDRDDLHLIPIPTDLLRWPNKEMEDDYHDLVGLQKVGN